MPLGIYVFTELWLAWLWNANIKLNLYVSYWQWWQLSRTSQEYKWLFEGVFHASSSQLTNTEITSNSHLHGKCVVCGITYYRGFGLSLYFTINVSFHKASQGHIDFNMIINIESDLWLIDTQSPHCTISHVDIWWMRYLAPISIITITIIMMSPHHLAITYSLPKRYINCAPFHVAASVKVNIPCMNWYTILVLYQW